MALNCGPLPSSEMICGRNSLLTFDAGASVNQQAVTLTYLGSPRSTRSINALTSVAATG
jgi:hypothetical protein